jgi:hypothetical protein
MANPGPLLLAYSTNVHPSRSLADVRALLARYTRPIYDRVFGSEVCGVELHLSMRTARELASARPRRELSDFLRDHGLYLFSVNAFPLLDFHARRVKERVYRPSWAEADRVRWTGRIAEILASLLPPDVVGTLSTVGGGFRPETREPEVLRALAKGYLRVLDRLHRIESRTGRRILLAVEPEPDTTLETTDEVIEFVESTLIPLAWTIWRRPGVSRAKIEERVRRFFTVNYDACHASVLFQDLLGSLRRLRRAGIRIGKVHVTSALALPRPHRRPRAYAQLRSLHEPRYFHQVCGRDAAGQLTYRGLDLDELPRRWPPSGHPEVEELRTHFHVPLFRQSWGLLGTTRDETRDLVLEVVRRKLCPQLVVETYTWPLLQRGPSLTAGISREFRWLQGVLADASP